MLPYVHHKDWLESGGYSDMMERDPVVRELLRDRILIKLSFQHGLIACLKESARRLVLCRNSTLDGILLF